MEKDDSNRPAIHAFSIHQFSCHWLISNQSVASVRMSVFFFRLHNLRREEEKKRNDKKKGLRRGRYTNALTLAPSRLFERSPLTPADSLDEIAQHIPRWRTTSSLACFAFSHSIFFPPRPLSDS
ncbi:hypothetical protein J437_LFUL014522 [Ladona fulva]|uniref:Uncharacterized protein n=1 Tax=Ladona fulva TaxID=123851 RepID=A0A8K0JWF4_LADFU|nr:hypothetical protein J437_LFUL014522 [Ladona fulva]